MNTHVPDPPDSLKSAQDNFCVLPWIHVQFNAEGTVKPCCRAIGSISESGRAMSLYGHRFEQIWNSAYMRNIRQSMANGTPISDCALCQQDEARGQMSYRQASNNKWLPLLHTNQAELISVAAAKGYVWEELPVYLQFNLGNLCNLKCRMCSSSYSSQIARDLAHARWSPPVDFHRDGLLRWNANTLRLDPTANAGFREGFYPPEMHEEISCRWTDGSGLIELPLDRGVRVDSLHLEILAYRPFVTHGVNSHVPLEISVNGTPIYSAELSRGIHQVTLDLSDISTSDHLRVALKSPSYRRQSDARQNGIGIIGITFHRIPAEKRAPQQSLPIDMRFFGRRPWHEQPSLIYGELLNRVSALREIYFTGGEPLISPEALEILNYLINSDVAGQITVQINSNCTHVPEHWLAALSRFKKVDFALSLDGMGECYEYIRYPAKWTEVSANIEKLKSIPNISLTAVPIVHAYNMLGLVDLCRYCDSVHIKFALMEHHGHRHLDLSAMPSAARALAADRLRDYVQNECKPENFGTVKGMIRYLETCHDHSTHEVLREFMLFSNDLDRDRRQSFGRTHSELLRIIVATGFVWTDETLHFGQDQDDSIAKHGELAPVPGNAPHTSLTEVTSTELIELANELCDQGEKHYANNDVASAESSFLKAIQTHQGCARAHNNLGVLYWQTSRQDKAIDVLARAVSFFNNDRVSVFNYVEMLITSRQRMNEARSLITGFVLNHPNDTEAAALLLEIED